MTYRHTELVLAGCLAIGLTGWDAGPAGAQDAPPSPSPETEADAGTGAGADPDGPADGPEMILAPGEVDNEESDAGQYRVEIDPLRGMQQGRMRREQRTTIGGYGELHLNMVKPEDDGFSSILDFHRFVIFFAHRFNDRFQFYSEVELEHAFVANSDGVAIPGSVQIEQAMLDWRLLKGSSTALYL
ncbi:MAG: hypothetical protein WBM75_16605, partial [Polyangiales bacterium]